MVREFFSRETVVKEWVYRALWAHLILSFILDLVR